MAICRLVSDRLSRIEVLPLPVSSQASDSDNPWTEFIEMFEGDAEFAAIAGESLSIEAMLISKINYPSPVVAAKICPIVSASTLPPLRITPTRP